MTGVDIVPITYGYEYDKKGRLTASVIASADAREYTYDRNKQGQVIRRNGKGGRWVYADENDTEGNLTMVDIDVTDYVWNAAGYLESETYTYMQEWTHAIRYTYNPNGSLSSYSMYYENGAEVKPAFTTFLHYDANGLLTRTETVEGDITMSRIFTYTYR